MFILFEKRSDKKIFCTHKNVDKYEHENVDNYGHENVDNYGWPCAFISQPMLHVTTPFNIHIKDQGALKSIH